MLNNIAIYTFLTISIILLVLSNRIEEIENLLNLVPINITISDNDFPILAVIFALFIAIFSRVVKLHDKISNILRIRHYYDIIVIIYPILKEVIKYKESGLLKIIFSDRNQIMYNIFYKYASSNREQCKIDFNLVILALTQFTGFWITIETIVYLIFTIAISLIFNDLVLFKYLLIIISVSIIIGIYFLYTCKRETRSEIKAILNVPEYKQEITNYFHGLLNK